MHMATGWSDKGAGTEDKQMRPRRAGGRRVGGGSDRVENNTSPPTRPRPLACAQSLFHHPNFLYPPPHYAAVPANHPPSEVTFTSDISLSLLPPPPCFFFLSFSPHPSDGRVDEGMMQNGSGGGEKKEFLFSLVSSDPSRLGVPAYQWDVTLSS